MRKKVLSLLCFARSTTSCQHQNFFAIYESSFFFNCRVYMFQFAQFRGLWKSPPSTGSGKISAVAVASPLLSFLTLLLSLSFCTQTHTRTGWPLCVFAWKEEIWSENILIVIWKTYDTKFVGKPVFLLFFGIGVSMIHNNTVCLENAFIFFIPVTL